MTDSADVTRWPFDFSDLKRGDSVPFQKVKDSYGIHPEKASTIEEALARQKQLQMKVLKVRDLIEEHFWVQHQDRVRIIQNGEALLILTAQEQDDWSVNEYRNTGRRFARVLRYDSQNDVAELTGDQRKRREDRILTMTWRKQQLGKKPPPRLTNRDGDDD